MDLFNPALDENVTFVRPAYFFILGFSGIPNMNYYYVFLIFVYIVSVFGNVFVMTVIYLDCTLQTPKYIVVFSLAFADICGSSALVPMLLHTFLFGHQYISYNNCLSYMFFTFFLGSMQSMNLAILAYDRLVAITFPLRYHVLVTHRVMFVITGLMWLIISLMTLLATGLITRLSFCRSLVIKSYFCDHGPLFRLACNDYTPSFVWGTLCPFVILWCPLLFIFLTYISIGVALTKISTSLESLKALKTCSAHLMLVAIYYLPITVNMGLGLSGVFPTNVRIINWSFTSILPPMLNPIIYVLQTEEFKVSIKRLVKTARGAISLSKR